MRNLRWTLGVVVMALGACSPALAEEDPCAPPTSGLPDDPQSRKEVEPHARAAWCREVKLALDDGRLAATVSGEDRKRAYADLIGRWQKTAEGQAFTPLYSADAERYLREVGVSRLARSFDAGSTNPRRVGLIERSGVTDLVSLAVQGTNLISADDNAVTINLGAAALLCGACRDMKKPATTRYEAAGGLTRFAGSFTFGAKIPEKDITGFSGVPSADKLFDVIVWDVKWRIIGDRDPRSKDWRDLLLGNMGGLALFSSIARGVPVVPEADAQDGGALALALDEMIKRHREEGVGRIAGSLQISAKFAGQHLTEQKGMNKYTGVVMLDKGVGALDGNLNVSFGSVQNVTLASGSVATLKQWKVAGGLVGTILKDLVVSGRGTELTVSGEAAFPVGVKITPEQKTTFKADVALKFPISKTLELPFSVTYTNDSNNLAKKRFVTGQVGIHYDFGALKRLISGTKDE